MTKSTAHRIDIAFSCLQINRHEDKRPFLTFLVSPVVLSYTSISPCRWKDLKHDTPHSISKVCSIPRASTSASVSTNLLKRPAPSSTGVAGVPGPNQQMLSTPHSTTDPALYRMHPFHPSHPHSIFPVHTFTHPITLLTTTAHKQPQCSPASSPPSSSPSSALSHSPPPSLSATARSPSAGAHPSASTSSLTVLSSSSGKVDRAMGT